MVMAGWDDVPHLGEDEKRRMLAECEPHLRDSRSKGIPSIGAGAIYPVPEDEVLVDPFEIPDHWPRVYGLDVGWNRTAAVWGAIDRENDVVYLYSEHYQGEQEPSTHVAGINSRGAWIPGTIDPASRGRSQKDGEKLLEIYTDLGLDLTPADNSRESGLFEVHQRLATGRLKVFKTLNSWRGEYRIYHRDEKGHIVKKNDHLMDACVTGDTLVWTSEGQRTIESLVGQEGLVLSRSGAWCRFIGARKTIEDTPIVSAIFEDGSVIRCTPDHPFLTPCGWVEAQHLQGLQAYNAVSQSNQTGVWKSRSFHRLSRSLMAFAIGAVAGTFSAMESVFTGSFGSMRTAGRCPMDMTCTTTMRTGATTSPQTSNSWSKPTTHRITTLGMTAGFRKLLLRLRSTGTPQRPESSGTSNTMQRLLPSCTSVPTWFACTAEKVSRVCSMGSPSSVATTAKRGIVGRLALTTSNALAWFAEAALWRIATRKSPHARADALVRCVAVQSSGRADVFCLTVPGPSAFAIGPGLVVHNTRYLAVSGLDIAKVNLSAEGWKGRRRLY